MGGGPTAVTAKSRAQGIGIGKRGDRLEGGGDRESTAIREDNNVMVSMGSRTLGLEARTSPPEGLGDVRERGWMCNSNDVGLRLS